MADNKIRNYKVLVNLAKDPISSHFSSIMSRLRIP